MSVGPPEERWKRNKARIGGAGGRRQWYRHLENSGKRREGDGAQSVWDEVWLEK